MSSKSYSFVSSAVIASLIALGSVATAHAAPVLGGQVFSNGGDVMVTFLGSDAGYDNLLSISSDPNTVIFEGHVSSVNLTVDLGKIAIGTELIFQLNNQQGNIWYMGAGWRNSDGLEHAMVDSSYGPNLSLVGFEDLPGGGDRDYNDLIFSISNPPAKKTITISGERDNNRVPDASSTLPLVALGLAGLAGIARRRRQS